MYVRGGMQAASPRPPTLVASEGCACSPHCFFSPKFFAQGAGAGGCFVRAICSASS